ncbi:hypothetical protein [Jiella pelagia]|uniref:Uncharacterized protein n=1 Tax=Jiella pelagia TaxID=2986949 RepID=A0ABY7C5M3_9HYPH|nr:hypothetical protein [Jiella pelagia]WAP70635.1 hypothetical protein OH818_11800 [Jiella pelagia]
MTAHNLKKFLGKISKNISAAIKESSFLYNFFGAVVAAIGFYNIYVAYTKTPLSRIMFETLSAYRMLSHGAFDAILFWMPIDVNPIVKDLSMIYIIIGGTISRLNAMGHLPSYEARGINLALNCLLFDKPLFLSIAGRKIEYSSFFSRNRFTKFYACMPNIVRRIIDIFLWPLLIRQIWNSRLIIRTNYFDGTFTTHATNMYPSDRMSIVLIANRRFIFLFQLIMIVLWIVIISLLNAYSLGIPQR